MKNRQVTIKINHKTYSVEKNRSILSICNDMGIDIPALCHNEALKPYGACRLCMVEVISDNQKHHLEASCTLKAKNGMEILTETKKIIKYRRLLFEFLLSEAPDSTFIKEYAAKYGVFETHFPTKESKKNLLGNKCILCGQCVRVCEEIVGAAAIGYIGRGYLTEINTPFNEKNDVCTGCKACAEVCPTQAICFEDLNGFRTMTSWNNTKIPLKKCTVCGKFYATSPMLAFACLNLPENLKHTMKEMCPDCKKKISSQKQISFSLSMP